MLIQSSWVRKLCAAGTHTTMSTTTMAAIPFANSTIFSKTSIFLRRNLVGVSTFSTTFSVSSDKLRTKKWRQSVIASTVELGNIKISKEGYYPLPKITSLLTLILSFVFLFWVICEVNCL